MALKTTNTNPIPRFFVKELIEQHKRIYPHDYNLLDGDGYVLTVKEETALHYLVI